MPRCEADVAGRDIEQPGLAGSLLRGTESPVDDSIDEPLCAREPGVCLRRAQFSGRGGGVEPRLQGRPHRRFEPRHRLSVRHGNLRQRLSGGGLLDEVGTADADVLHGRLEQGPRRVTLCTAGGADTQTRAKRRSRDDRSDLLDPAR